MKHEPPSKKILKKKKFEGESCVAAKKDNSRSDHRVLYAHKDVKIKKVRLCVKKNKTKFHRKDKEKKKHYYKFGSFIGPKQLDFLDHHWR